MASSTAHERVAGLVQSAQSSKDAGNTALRGGDTKRASFCYKRVYLYLAEYLPPKMVAKTQISSGGGGDENAGLMALLGGQKGAQNGNGAAQFASLSLADQLTVVELYGTTQNNLAQANLRLESYREGVACATCVLEQLTPFLPDPANVEDSDVRAQLCRVRELFEHNTKALLRRASCLVALGEYDRAEVDLAELERLAAASGVPADVAVADLRARIEAAKKTAAQREKKMMQKMFA